MKLDDDAYLPLFMTDTLYLAPNKATAVEEVASIKEAPQEEVVAAPGASADKPEASVEAAPKAEAPATAEASALVYFGDNAKRIALLVHYPAETHIAADHKAFLEKILQAVKVNWSDVALINLATQAADHPELLKGGWQKVIGFGVDHPWLQRLSPYQPFIKGTKGMLLTESLDLIAADKARKAQLWNALQQIFSV